jgi:hypothetical protein
VDTTEDFPSIQVLQAPGEASSPPENILLFTKIFKPIPIQTIRNFFSSRAAECVDVWNIVPSEISAKTVNCFTENTEDMVVKRTEMERSLWRDHMRSRKLHTRPYMGHCT